MAPIPPTEFPATLKNSQVTIQKVRPFIERVLSLCTLKERDEFRLNDMAVWDGGNTAFPREMYAIQVNWMLDNSRTGTIGANDAEFHELQQQLGIGAAHVRTRMEELDKQGLFKHDFDLRVGRDAFQIALESLRSLWHYRVRQKFKLIMQTYNDRPGFTKMTKLGEYQFEPIARMKTDRGTGLIQQADCYPAAKVLSLISANAQHWTAEERSTMIQGLLDSFNENALLAQGPTPKITTFEHHDQNMRAREKDTRDKLFQTLHSLLNERCEQGFRTLRLGSAFHSHDFVELEVDRPSNESDVVSHVRQRDTEIAVERIPDDAEQVIQTEGDEEIKQERYICEEETSTETNFGGAEAIPANNIVATNRRSTHQEDVESDQGLKPYHTPLSRKARQVLRLSSSGRARGSRSDISKYFGSPAIASEKQVGTIWDFEAAVTPSAPQGSNDNNTEERDETKQDQEPDGSSRGSTRKRSKSYRTAELTNNIWGDGAAQKRTRL